MRDSKSRSERSVGSSPTRSITNGCGNMIIIQGKKSRDKYYYDAEKLTVTDKVGNTIKLMM